MSDEPRMVKVNDGFEVYECDARLVDATLADIMRLEERIARLEMMIGVLRRAGGLE